MLLHDVAASSKGNTDKNIFKKQIKISFGLIDKKF